MAQLRFTLHVQRDKGTSLVQVREIPDVYCETHGQITFAWRAEGVPAARPLHGCTVMLQPDGVQVTGFEREGETLHYQEWRLIPKLASMVSTEIPSLSTEVLAMAAAPLPPVSASAPEPEVEPAATGAAGALIWSPELETGVAAVDADHKILVDLVNQIQEARHSSEPLVVMGSVLTSLIEYTDYHFQREERVQEAVAYPGLENHKLLHEELKDTAISYFNQFKADPGSVDVDAVDAFLKHWLVDHIMKEDMAFKPYAIGKPEAEAAAASLSFMDFAEDAVEDDDLISRLGDPAAMAEAMADDAGDLPPPPPMPELDVVEDGAAAIGEASDDDLGNLLDAAPPVPAEPLGMDPAATPSEAVSVEASGDLEALPAQMEWSDALSVGVKAVDDDHKILIDLVNQIQEVKAGRVGKNVVGSVLTSLVEYTDYHFAREERIQEAIGFPNLEPHHAQHEALKRDAIAFLDSYHQSPDTVDIDALDAFLKRWLLEHIMRSDMAFRPFAEANPQAAETAADSLSFMAFAAADGAAVDDDLFKI